MHIQTSERVNVSSHIVAQGSLVAITFQPLAFGWICTHANPSIGTQASDDRLGERITDAILWETQSLLRQSQNASSAHPAHRVKAHQIIGSSPPTQPAKTLGFRMHFRQSGWIHHQYKLHDNKANAQPFPPIATLYAFSFQYFGYQSSRAQPIHLTVVDQRLSPSQGQPASSSRSADAGPRRYPRTRSALCHQNKSA